MIEFLKILTMSGDFVMSFILFLFYFADKEKGDGSWIIPFIATLLAISFMLIFCY